MMHAHTNDLRETDHSTCDQLTFHRVPRICWTPLLSKQVLIPHSNAAAMVQQKATREHKQTLWPTVATVQGGFSRQKHIHRNTDSKIGPGG
jgi:hypothetical protein